MARRLPTASQIDELLSFLPRLEIDAPCSDSLIECLCQNGFILERFDWMRWDEGRTHAEDLEWIGRADLSTLCKLFTAHVRNDRFCEGHFESMLRRGYVSAMLHRLAELQESTHGPT